jgi:diguanylate cyclase (GGDEF)-like protein
MDELSKCKQNLAIEIDKNYTYEMLLEQKERELEELRYIDPISGIKNNNSLIDKLKKNENRCYILLNIDNFSNINNAYGYESGNELLKQLPPFLDIVKPQDFELYRFCADKFILLSEISRDKDEIASIIESIISFFNSTEITLFDDIPIKITFTIGASVSSGIIAITQAELALKEVRKSRRNGYYIYDQKLENLEMQQEDTYWIDRIKSAILDDEMIVYYQPMLNTKTGKIEKYECLARINDEGEIVSPYRFLSAASQTRVLHLITQSIITQAFKMFSDTECEFSINITKDDLNMNYLETYLLKHCKKYNIAPMRVVVEILEDISTLNEEDILDQLNSLRINGFKVAVDDFGAENSNFSRLMEFKPDYLKIDGVFIKNIINDRNCQLITESIVHICKESGIKVIAEFIHNKEVLDKITELGIDYAQGFYIGAPSTELVC